MSLSQGRSASSGRNLAARIVAVLGCTLVALVLTRNSLGSEAPSQASHGSIHTASKSVAEGASAGVEKSNSVQEPAPAVLAAPSPSATLRCTDVAQRCLAKRQSDGQALPEGVQLLNATLYIAPGTEWSVTQAVFAEVRALCLGSPLRAFVTYADAAFERARKRITREAAAIGDFDVVVEMTRVDLDPDFYAKNKGILDQRRGGGYWLWKPWAAARVGGLLRDNDYLVYLDSGCKIAKSLQPWLDTVTTADPGWYVLEFEERVARWTKGDIFKALGITVADYGEYKQVLAGIWAMRKTPATWKLLEEWLHYAQDEQLITDAPSIEPNPPGFSENRHDQSIFSLLIRIHGVKTIAQDNTYPEEHARRVGAVVIAARSRD